MIPRLMLSTVLVLLLGLLAGNTATTAFAAGTGGGGTGTLDGSASIPKSPEAVANGFFRTGVRHKERAWKAEQKAIAAKNDKAREKALARARTEYGKAVESQIQALRTLPTHYEAANELGYALRKTGDFKRAIGAYNLALELKPDFWQAVEYRGEALLAMGFLEETKDAYMTLFRADLDLAAQLMTAIETWLSQQPDDAESIRDFAQWVSERKRLTSFVSDPLRPAADRW